MRRRVIVTRPEPGATATAERLAAEGFEPVLLPLTRIEPLDAALPAHAAEFDALALTSANAVRFAPPEWLASLSALPCFAVGEATARMASEKGLNVVAAGADDGVDLARKIIARHSAGSRLLYPCGRVRTEGFEVELERAGIAVGPVEIYDAAAIEYSPEEIGRRIGSSVPWAALVHSPAGGRLLADLLSRPRIGPHFAGMCVLGISDNAVAALKHLAWQGVEVASEPSEPALLALIKAKV